MVLYIFGLSSYFVISTIMATFLGRHAQTCRSIAGWLGVFSAGFALTVLSNDLRSKRLFYGPALRFVLLSLLPGGATKEEIK